MPAGTGARGCRLEGHRLEVCGPMSPSADRSSRRGASPRSQRLRCVWYHSLRQAPRGRRITGRDMMPTLGAPELIIILVIIILIFGVGKLPEVGQALGKGIREFRGAADSNDEEPPPPVAKPAAPAPAPVAVEAPRPAPVVVEAPRPATVAAAAPATVAYIAVTGDTPEKVATSHGVSVDDLLAANGWSRRDRALDEGDRVMIPVKTSV